VRGCVEKRCRKLGKKGSVRRSNVVDGGWGITVGGFMKSESDFGGWVEEGLYRFASAVKLRDGSKMRSFRFVI